MFTGLHSTRDTHFPLRLVLAMLTLLVAVAAASVWDADQQLDEALERLARRHHVLAFTVAHDLATRMRLLEQDDELHGPNGPPGVSRARALGRLLGHLGDVQREGGMTILLQSADSTDFRTADGRTLQSATLARAFAEGRQSLVLDLDPAEAAVLGFPARRAVAGFASVDDEQLVKLHVAILSTGRYESGGYRHARWRTIITGGGVALIVLAFGGLLLRQQRRSFKLSADLERAALERARDDELARADRFAILAALSSGIAHELGTPLTILVGRVEQLGALAKAEARMQRPLQSIAEQVERMRGIVAGFMALARGEAPALAPYPAASLASEVQELVRHRFERSEVSLLVDVDPGLPRVLCDPRLFLQALVNLLVNACQVSAAADSVTLHVFATDGHVTFDVLDEGEGIRSEDAAQAHAPFFTTRAQVGGTGLGLAIAKEIVEQHRGTFQIGPRAGGDGAAGRGTRASIVLPAHSVRELP